MNRCFKKIFQALTAVGILFFCAFSVHAENLYVFFPSPLHAKAMQDKLSQALPGIDVTVFGRQADFRKKVSMDGPDAILTKEPVIEHIGSYAIRLRGERGGSILDSYTFLSVEKGVVLSDTKKLSVGVFDLLGRKDMKNLIGKYFKDLPHLKRISKMEDMLQLLTFNMADAILITEAHVDYYRKLSNLHFVMTPAPGMKIGILALASGKGKDAAQIIKAFTGMDANTKTLLEVDNWKSN